MESDDETIIPSTSGTSSEIRRMINAEKLVLKQRLEEIEMSDMSEEDILSSQISNIFLSNETASDEMQYEAIKTSGL